jgi:hypothetical protein
MSTGVGRLNVIRRMLNWVVRSLTASRAGAVALDMRHRVPMFLIPRALEPARPVRSLADCDFARTLATWMFSARLKSVALQNMPKSLKGPRRRPAGGKIMPKKGPRVLKRYTQKPAVAEMPLQRARAFAALRSSADVVTLQDHGAQRSRSGPGPARRAA